MFISKHISKGLFFAFAASFLWACTIVNARYLLQAGENPLNLTVWVNFFTLIPWLFLFQKHIHEFKTLSIHKILLLIIIGISGSIGISYLQALALNNTTAVNFSFLYRTIIVFTIIFAWIFFKEKITSKKLVLVVLILIGSYLLTTNGTTITLTRGDIYTLLMAASAAFIANILVKHTVSKMHPDLSGAVTSFVTIITLFIIASVTDVLKIPDNMIFILIGSLFLFLQIFMRNRAYTFATASFVTMIFSLTPLFVAILSFPLLHERLDMIEIIGGLIIVGSIFFVEKFKI